MFRKLPTRWGCRLYGEPRYIVTIITQTIRVNNSTINLDSIIAQLLDESRRINSIEAKNSYKAPIAYDSNYSNSNDNDNSYSNDVEMSMQTNNNKANNSFKQEQVLQIL